MGRGAHGRQIRQIDAQQFPRNQPGIFIGREMHAGGHHILGNDHRPARPGLVNSGIVGKTKGRRAGGRQRREYLFDHLEFVHLTASRRAL